LKTFLKQFHPVPNSATIILLAVTVIIGTIAHVAIFSHLSSSILLILFVKTPFSNWRCPRGC